MLAPTLPSATNHERIGGTYGFTLSAGITYELPFFTFDLTILQEFRIRFESPTGSPTLYWAIRPMNQDGSPDDTTIASGTVSPTSTGWYTLFPGQSHQISPGTYLYLELLITSGTSVRIVGDGLGRGRTLSTNLLIWDGSTLSIAKGCSHWCLLYTDGTDWYGNPFTSNISNTRTRAGTSYRLPKPTRLLGVSMYNWTNIPLDTNLYIVRLWETDPTSWLPTTEITSRQVPGWIFWDAAYTGQITTTFGEEYTLQNFAITVERTDLSTFNIREHYAPLWTVVDPIAPVRGIEWTGTAWTLLPTTAPIQHLWIRETQETTSGGTTIIAPPQHLIIY